MLVSLDFEVEFANTGKKLKGSHNFEMGLTAITGANEAGKSLRIEMIRYALFGTKALRAEAKTYKFLSVKLGFAVNGLTHFVTRAGTKAEVSVAGVPVANGTKPVNECIIALLGYDMDVFDVTNACLQGDVEALTKKTPAERKRMVDRTIGLDAVDKVIGHVNEDAAGVKKAIDALKNTVIQQYSAPEYPFAEQMNMEALKEKEAEVQSKLQRRQYLQGLIDAARASEPLPLELKEEVEEPLEVLQANAVTVAAEIAQIAVSRSQLHNTIMLQHTFKGRDVKHLTDYINGNYADKWNAYNAYKARVVKSPTFTHEQLDHYAAGEDIIFRRTKAPKLMDVACPECKHAFGVNPQTGVAGDQSDPEYDAFDWTRWKLISDNLLGHSVKNVRNQLNAFEEFSKLEVVPEPDLDYDKDASASMLTMLGEYEKIKDVDTVAAEKTLDETESALKLTALTIQNKIKLQQTNDVLKANQARQMEAYAAYVAVQQEHAKEIADLEGLANVYSEVKEQISKLQAYEQGMATYLAKQQAQENSVKILADLETQLLVLGKVKKSLNDLKPKVKSHLLPSLNAVASKLLFQMTDGARKEIIIDDDFDVQVDKQPVNTLSGSAKAAVNLALRIGLSTVLTNKVFSVFLADEIDAAMNKERADYTANCLKNLTGTIGQILLVSHRDPEADHHIEL